MIHLHRTITLVMVCICATQFSAVRLSAQPADTTVCNTYMDSVGLYSYRYDANDSLRYFAEKFFDCSQSLGDAEGQMEALSVLGVTCMRENNFQEALEFFEQNRQMAIDEGNRQVEAQVLINVGSVYTAMDSSKRAMEVLMQSAKIFEEQNDSTMLMFAYTNIGILFGKIRERGDQLEYSKKAFAMGGEVVDSRRTLTLGTNLAVNYLNSGILDTAEILGLELLEKSREFGNSKTTTQILSHLANIANRKEQHEKAIEYANEVMEYEGKLKHDHTFSSVLVYRGAAYMALGNPKQAVLDLEKALVYAESEQSLQRREMALKHLQLAYSSSGRYEDAYRTMVAYKTANDSLASQENVRILNDIETKYQTEKKEQQLRDMNQQQLISELKIKQRNIWIIVLIVLALLIAAAIFLVSRQRLMKQQRKVLENRLLSLRVQLNPHFIFNALTAVQNYMLSGKDLREATKYLSNFAKVMRAFLEYNQEEEITLDKELHALELYVGIQKLRFSNGFEFELNFDDEIIPEEVLVPPMIMQPLIENAIEHGIRNIENGCIRLSYTVSGDRLSMRLSDNGIGRSRAAVENPKAKDKTSLATKITEERVSLLNQKGDGQYGFEITDNEIDGTGTVVTFTIPYRLT